MTSWAWRQFNDQPWEAADSQFYSLSLGAIVVLVLSSMAVDAQGDEVLCRVVSQHAAEFPVMDLQVSRRPAPLTTPSVSL